MKLLFIPMKDQIIIQSSLVSLLIQEDLLKLEFVFGLIADNFSLN